VSKEHIITAGHSSGAETSSHLMLAFPEIFGCAGVLNGGFPLTLQRTQRDSKKDPPDYDTPNSDEVDYKILNETIQKLVDEGLLGDQTLLKELNRAAYLFMGGNDNTVFNWATKEINKYYEDNGVKVKFDNDPELGH